MTGAGVTLEDALPSGAVYPSDVAKIKVLPGVNPRVCVKSNLEPKEEEPEPELAPKLAAEAKRLAGP